MSPCTGRRDQERRARCKVGREHNEHHHLHEEQRHLRRFLSLPDSAANVSVNIVVIPSACRGAGGGTLGPCRRGSRRSSGSVAATDALSFVRSLTAYCIAIAMSLTERRNNKGRTTRSRSSSHNVAGHSMLGTVTLSAVMVAPSPSSWRLWPRKGSGGRLGSAAGAARSARAGPGRDSSCAWR